MRNPILEPFRDNALFRNIPAEALNAAQIVLEEISLEEEKVVFREGDAADYCYLVGTGAVRITKALPDGQQELLSVVQAGGFFGELALYDASPRSARATTAVPTRLGRIDQEAFDRLRRAAPLEMTAALADVSIDRVRHTNDRLVRELVAAGRLRELGSDLSTLSHNLRSPLATIHDTASLLAERLNAETRDIEKDRRFLQIVLQTSERALEQIDRLMARLRGELDSERSRIGVGDLLAELREQIQGHLKPGVDYREELLYRGDVIVDRGDWVAALANLIKNSTEALPSEGGGVTVTVAEKEGEVVVFRVSDTGRGIAAEKLPYFFDREFTDKEGGTGLGTAHVHAVARQHGGRARVESQVGRGTTVEMWIPKPQD